MVSCANLMKARCYFCDYDFFGTFNFVDRILKFYQVALLLGTIVRCVPLPQHPTSSNREFLTVTQMETIGSYFIEVLTLSRHAGAIDKTSMGFQVLCEILMQSRSEELFKLPAVWLQV